MEEADRRSLFVTLPCQFFSSPSNSDAPKPTKWTTNLSNGEDAVLFPAKMTEASVAPHSEGEDEATSDENKQKKKGKPSKHQQLPKPQAPVT